MAARKTPSGGGKPDKLWRDALQRAVKREIDDADGKPTKALEVMADKTVKKAVEGDMAAIKEIGDRLDGRPAQQIQAMGDDGEGSLIVKIVKFSDLDKAPSSDNESREGT